jgi:hypothetical protein
MTAFTAGQVLTATQLNSQLNDTGWVTMTTAGTTGDLARYRVVNNVVHVQVSATIPVGSGATVTVVTAANGVPAPYRPTSQEFFSTFSGNVVGYARVGSDGSITAHGSTGAMTSLAGSISYPVG